MLLGATLLAALIGLGAAISAQPARADGDPASDVLATQTLFLPWDADVPAEQQAQLISVLASAERSGHPVRVALIASRSDLGSVTALWHEPQGYAEFLGAELSLVYRGPVLVVMPNGFGLDRFDLSLATIKSTLSGIAVPRDGEQLADDTLTALVRLAGASGRRLSAPAVAVRLPPGAGDTVAWAVFAAGLALVALAWTASLRTLPLRRGAPF